MLNKYLFKDLYHDRWGDPCNPNAVDRPSPADNGGTGGKGILGRLAERFRRRRDRPSAWSFTIPNETSDTEDEAEIRPRTCDEEPKFLAIAKALSRNC